MSTLSITAAITDSTISLTRRTDNLAVTTAAGNVDNRIVSVSSGGETTFTLDTNIGNAGYVYAKNLDATNYVDLGFATTVYPLRLKAGQVGIFPITPATSALYLLANTAACRVEIMVHEA